ncbi:TonB-dependent receptor [Chitinophaga sp. Mgbs1]|uniref:TonB-dependent receptor n=1 Tax=Chitinophaga solisilvae TaxID=1233460 RepID=A0A3S1AZV2_9BACT|nr:TonB-dependent receptor [Chitinophaga solisilvae]
MSMIIILGLSLFTPFISFAITPDEEATGTIRGKVLTSDGRPAADVIVLLKETNQTTVSESDGAFAFSRVTPGNHEIVISLMGHNTIVEQVQVAAGKISRVTLKLTTSSKELQEVVVAGNQQKLIRTTTYDVAKIPLKNMENPQVYTTITKELLKQQLVFSVDDAMQNATGITKMWGATGRGGDGGSFYVSRGFVVQSQLRNGIAGNVTSRIDAANLDRIEVIKGPSATLFGNALTSYGGLINRVTKKPYDVTGGEVAIAAGSFGFNRVSADINTPLTKEKDVLLRVNAAYNYEGSFQDYGFSRGIALAPSLTYKASDRLTFNFDAEYYAGQNIGDQVFFFTYGMPISQLGADRADKLKLDYKRSYLGDNSLYQTYRNTNLFGQMNYRLSDKWSMQTNVTTTNSFSNGPSPYFYLLANDSISRNDQFTNNSTDRVVEIQQNFNGDFNIGGLRNRFVGGLDFFHRKSDQVFGGSTFDAIPSTGRIPTYTDFNRVNLDKFYSINGTGFPYLIKNMSNTYSAYISDVLNITDNFLVQAGLRADYFDFIGKYNDTTGKYDQGYTQFALSPKFGIVYQPLKDKISLFANYQNGFTNKTGNSFDGKVFKPEQANQIEGGVKVALLDGRLTGTVSYYDIKVKDLVRADPAHQNFSIQDGNQRSKGVEAEIVANPVRGLDIVAGYAYNDSKFEKANPDVEGLRPTTAGAPTTANLWVSYRLTSGAAKGLGIGFGGNYSSEIKVVNDNFVGTFSLPSYVVLNSSLFYEAKRLRFGLKVNNLTNKQYYTGYTTINPQRLRNVNASIAYKF